MQKIRKDFCKGPLGRFMTGCPIKATPPRPSPGEPAFSEQLARREGFAHAVSAPHAHLKSPQNPRRYPTGLKSRAARAPVVWAGRCARTCEKGGRTDVTIGHLRGGSRPARTPKTGCREVQRP